MRAAHFYKWGQFLSLAVLLSLPLTTFADEYETVLDGEPAFKPKARPRPAAEPSPQPAAESPRVDVPVAAPVAAKGKGGTFRDCADCPEMVVIPAGRFEMGEPDNAHEVPVASFAMSKTEVTQGQWKALMRRNPSYFKQCGDDCPVESVSWEDVQSFIEILNEKTGKKYRLASGEEWEYACRAGGKHRYCGTADAYNTAWHKGNSDNKTHPVALQAPNAFGLYDMNGNVREWTAEGKDKYYMVRGGGYSDDLDHLYPHLKDHWYINSKEEYAGFRLVRSLP